MFYSRQILLLTYLVVVVEVRRGMRWAGETGTKRGQKNQGRNKKLKETKPKAQMDLYFLLISAFYINI